MAQVVESGVVDPVGGHTVLEVAGEDMAMVEAMVVHEGLVRALLHHISPFKHS